MSRPQLEVANIIRSAGQTSSRGIAVARWTHLKVLRAIERCRTAALGGHIDECSRCGHRAHLVQLVPYGECFLMGSAAAKGHAAHGVTPFRLSIKVCPSAARAVCRAAETCPCEGSAARLLRWPPAFRWDRPERRLPSWSGYCAPTTGRLSGCLVLLAARPLRRYVGARGAILVCHAALNIFDAAVSV